MTNIQQILDDSRDSGDAVEQTLFRVLSELCERGEICFADLLDWSPDMTDTDV